MRNHKSITLWACMLLLLMMAQGCIKGRPLDGESGPVISDPFAANAFEQLRRIDLGIEAADDIAWAARQAGFMEGDEYARFNSVAQQAISAVIAARGSVFLYLDMKEAGRSPSEAAVLEALENVNSWYLQVVQLKEDIESRTRRE